MGLKFTQPATELHCRKWARCEGLNSRINPYLNDFPQTVKETPQDLLYYFHHLESSLSLPRPQGLETALRFWFNKTFQTIFQTFPFQRKLQKLYLPRAMFLKLFNPECISKGTYPYGSHSFTLNPSRWRSVKTSWQPRSGHACFSNLNQEVRFYLG